MLAVLRSFQERGLIRFSLLGQDKIVKYSICNWIRFNRILDYNCPCQKDTGFFFLPISMAAELVGYGKCSEMDILLDMWISAIYCDERVTGSELGPVVYFRDGSGNPLVSYSQMAERWCNSRATVCRVMKKLEELGHISLVSFSGRYGSAIYLQNYLSTMFQISDTQVDKDEVALRLNIKLKTKEAHQEFLCSDEQGSVSPEAFCVSNLETKEIAAKVMKVLEIHGVSCVGCPRFDYMLYPLSDDCKGKIEIESIGAQPWRYCLDVLCGEGRLAYRFELNITNAQQGQGGTDCGKKIES